MKRLFSDIFISLIFFTFFVSLSVIFIVNFKNLYYFDIEYLQIPQISGYPKDIIISNYNTLIDYLLPFSKSPLSFPDFPSSKTALIHFTEVKYIFTFFYFTAFFSFLLLLIIIFYKRKTEDSRYLFISSIILWLFPIILLILCFFNFNRIFIFFHKLLFQNDYWYFNPATDPIITILPEKFFYHCACFLLFFLFLAGFLLFILYKYRLSKNFDNVSIALASQENK